MVRMINGSIIIIHPLTMTIPKSRKVHISKGSLTLCAFTGTGVYDIFGRAYFWNFMSVTRDSVSLTVTVTESLSLCQCQ